MLFSEPSFLFYFLPALLVMHAVAPTRARNLLLLLASLFFYAWGEPVFVLGLLAAIAWSALLALAIEASREDALRARVLTGLGVGGVIAFLGFYKYAGFAVENLNTLLTAFGIAGLTAPDPVLPIGISFFSFQAISYLVDVRRGRAPAQRNPVDAALYIAMFPQLIAGPIVRYEDVAGQLRERRVELADFASGLRRFSIGLAKKLLIANSLAVPVDAIFAAADAPAGVRPGAQDLSFGLAWLGAFAYAFQIYFDFSGYSDMAIGLARMFGFQYRENFAHPYVSGSVTEFWRRWHISLSSWFRDYVYLPLGGNRSGALRTHLNLWAVFLLCGLWHGAEWTFVLWGAWHGLWLSIERLATRVRIPTQAPLWRVATTFLIAVLGFVLFRAESLSSAGRLFAELAGAGTGKASAVAALSVAELWTGEVAFAFGLAVLGAHPAPARWGRRVLASTQAAGARGIAAAIAQALFIGGLMLACASRIAAGTYDPFIYFRF